MAADELLRFLVEALEREGIPYALAGSIAAMSYGEPRTTLDIDLVVALDPEAVTRLEDVFAAPDFYFDPQAAREAARTRGQFNVIHPSSGLKIDFFVVSDSIEESQIRRRVWRAVLPDLEAGFSPRKN